MGARDRLDSSAMGEREELLCEGNGDRVRELLLQSNWYSTVELPEYFSFATALSNSFGAADSCYVNLGLENTLKLIKRARGSSDCNYDIVHNKDGHFAWRALTLIHPFIYASLVRLITDQENWNTIRVRFEQFSQFTNIECTSLPVIPLGESKLSGAQISNWYNRFEKRSVELSARYPFVLKTDILNCYPSIYTHTIAWAIHGKEMAKCKRNKPTLLGNAIDSHLQAMNSGQTNGIRQGSVLMDLVAEMVLGYADLELGTHLKDANVSGDTYHILRYRDDYHIFCADQKTLGLIQLALVRVLRDLNLSLNPAKTIVSDDPITVVVKADKMAWLERGNNVSLSIPKYLHLLYRHAQRYPNTGSIVTGLHQIDQRLRVELEEGIWDFRETEITIALAVNFAIRNPKCIAIVASIISQLCEDNICNGNMEKTIEMLSLQFSRYPKNELLSLWLQRIVVRSLGKYASLNSSSVLTALVASTDDPLSYRPNGCTRQLWDCEWLLDAMHDQCPDLGELIKDYVSGLTVDLIDRNWIEAHPGPMGRDEVRVFSDYP
jgi:hypothetical protein